MRHACYPTGERGARSNRDSTIFLRIANQSWTLRLHYYTSSGSGNGYGFRMLLISSIIAAWAGAFRHEVLTLVPDALFSQYRSKSCPQHQPRESPPKALI